VRTVEEVRNSALSLILYSYYIMSIHECQAIFKIFDKQRKKRERGNAFSFGAVMGVGGGGVEFFEICLVIIGVIGLFLLIIDLSVN